MELIQVARSVGFLVAGSGMLIISRSARRLPEGRRGGGLLARERWASIRVLRREYSGNGYQMYKVGVALMVAGVVMLGVAYLVG